MIKKVFFVKIQFSINHLLAHGLNMTNTPGQSEPKSNGNEEVLCIPRGSSITGVSLVDCLMSYRGYSLESYPSAERRCPWCNVYRHRKCTWYEFKSWTRLIAFHIALIPLRKVWIQLFSLQLWVNNRAD